MAEERDSSDVLFTLLIGTAVGVGLALLFAPRSGKETRAQLNDWLEELQEKGNGLLKKAQQAIPARKPRAKAAASRSGRSKARGLSNGHRG